MALAALIAAQEDLGNFTLERKLSGQQTEWLSTFALLYQSIDVTRRLILDGAHASSAAALKQEWDGIAVLASISKGKVAFDKSPNVRNALGSIPHKQHRLLQPIAHLTGEGLGKSWGMQTRGNKDLFLPSPRPMPDVTIRLLNARTYLLGHMFLQLKSFVSPLDVTKHEGGLLYAMKYLDVSPNPGE